MKRKFKRDIDSLEKVFTFLHEFMTLHNVSQEVAIRMDLVVEELFTNMIKYNPGAREDINIRLQLFSNSLSIFLTDPNSQLFDITKVAEAKLDLPLQDRKPGGLGIHLVKTLTDSVRYEHENGTS
ncbi:MAG: ATP-binding protein, partial [Bacteroidota bacterium]